MSCVPLETSLICERLNRVFLNQLLGFAPQLELISLISELCIIMSLCLSRSVLFCFLFVYVSVHLHKGLCVSVTVYFMGSEVSREYAHILRDQMSIVYVYTYPPVPNGQRSVMSVVHTNRNKYTSVA